MEEVRWDIPFDPQDVGKIPMFVWCQTQEDAEKLCNEYCNSAETFIGYWTTYREETIYVIPANGLNWMFGSRNGFTETWKQKGYVPRVFCPITSVEVEDLI